MQRFGLPAELKSLYPARDKIGLWEMLLYMHWHLEIKSILENLTSWERYLRILEVLLKPSVGLKFFFSEHLAFWFGFRLCEWIFYGQIVTSEICAGHFSCLGINLCFQYSLAYYFVWISGKKYASYSGLECKRGGKYSAFKERGNLAKVQSGRNMSHRLLL
jgi:hypothetical protein